MFSGTNRIRRAIAVVAMAGLLGLAAACGGNDDNEVSADGGGYLHTEVTVDLSGAVSVKGRSTAPVPSANGVNYTSCNQYGKGEANDEGVKYFVVPRMLMDKIENKTVFVGVMVKNYDGPGSYDKSTLVDTGSPPGISFDGDDGLYYTQRKTTSKVTADADGGGRWDFTGLSVKGTNGVEGGPEVSGTITWTCKDN
jgi:hypothetical protein